LFDIHYSFLKKPKEKSPLPPLFTWSIPLSLDGRGLGEGVDLSFYPLPLLPSHQGRGII
jgi:hypothetical protein